MYNIMCLQGKRILITGGSAGIGKSCAEIISRLGGECILVGRDTHKLQRVCESLTGERHHSISFDLSEHIELIPSWLKDVSAKYGVLDGLIHCAGLQWIRALQITKYEDYRKLMTLNLDAAFMLVKGFRQNVVSKRPASIVLISSVSGLSGQAGNASYSASKGGLIALTRSLCLELVRDQIRVNCISPGLVETEIVNNMRKSLPDTQFNAILAKHPLGIGQPEDVAHAAAFLIANTGRWITGSNLVVDGGYTAG